MTRNKSQLIKVFFGGNLNETLGILMDESSITNILASDLSKSLSGFSGDLEIPNKGKTIEMLNNLWIKKSEHGPISREYQNIILSCLSYSGSIEEIISDVNLSLSEIFIRKILGKLGIKNELGKYNLDHFNNESIKSDCFSKIVDKSFNEKSEEAKKEKLKKILKMWIDKVEKTIENNEKTWFTESSLISIFYRFIQFSVSCGEDNRNKLSQILIKFFNSPDLSDNDKKNVSEKITLEYKEYKNEDFYRTPSENPIKLLFNHNQDLIKSIWSVKNYLVLFLVYSTSVAFFSCPSYSH